MTGDDLDAIASEPCIVTTNGGAMLHVDRRDALVAEVRRLRAENAALRALVARFYTQAWEDPLTDDEMALLDPIVNDAMREATGG